MLITKMWRSIAVSTLLVLTGCGLVDVTPGSGASPPNLANDTIAPSVPQSLSAATVSGASIQLTWLASTDTADGSGVASYHVLRDGIQVAQVPVGTQTYTDSSLAAATEYSFTVRAVDAAGNVSTDSALATATTPPTSSGDVTAPSIPLNLIAAATSSTSIHLNWGASTDNAGGSGLATYTVLRDGIQVAQVPVGTLSFVDSALSASTMYSYTVRAVDNAGNASMDSLIARATTPPTSTGDTIAPSVPLNVAATPLSSTSVRLTWSASADNTGGSGLASYRVLRGSTQVALIAAGTLAFTDTGLSASTLYSYTIRAVDNAGNVSVDSAVASATTLAISGVDTTAPSVPGNPAALAFSATSIQFTWAASIDNAGGSGVASYRILRGGTQIGQVPVGTLSYTETGLTASTQYSYSVRAVDNAGNASASSAVASATTLPASSGDTTPPSVPLNLAATALSSTSVGLTWSASTDNAGGSGLANYRVLRGGAQIAQLPAGTLAYTDTGLTASTLYSYTIRAVDNAANASANSPTATATTLPPSSGDTTPPSVPLTFAAKALTSTSVGLTWSASTDNAGGSGLASYRVLRGGVQIAQVPAGTLAYTNSGLTASTLYSYTIRAVDNAGNASADSLAATVTTLALPKTGMSGRPSNPTCLAPQRPGTGGGAFTLSVQPAFPNLLFNNLSGAFQAPGDGSRWFVTELDGHIRTFANSVGAATSNMFLDISARVISGGETGLFGMAFHPDFPGDPRVFVSYTTFSNGFLQSRISQFRSNDSGVTLDPTTESVLVTVDQPENNHNGGFIAFGPDRFLYFGLGDGGGGGDQHGAIGNGQNTQTLLGKILRIDIGGASGPVPYRIPANNPFAGSRACYVNGTSSANCPEIFAWGIRNPWKGSFDRQTGQLWVGDVGQNTWEEADRVNLGGNYGWRCREGASAYPGGPGLPGNCDAGLTLIDPVVQFANAGGSSITGGYVYRGSAYPALVGKYVFADFVRGLFTVDSTATPTVTATNLTSLPGIYVAAFAENQTGELLVVDYNGKLYNLLASGGGGTNTIPDKLSNTGCANVSNPVLPTAGMIPYVPNAPFWSDGATKQRWLALPDGSNIDTSPANGDWNFPARSVIRKDFSVGNQLIESRLLMRHPDGVWAGYTYHWNAAQTEATRVSAGLDVPLQGQTWHIPSESECMRCHTQAAGYALGPETGQLNGDLAYPPPPPPFTGNTANQVFTLNSIGLFSPAITAAPQSLIAYPNPMGTGGSLAERARSYLHTNCSQCHRPGGGTPVNMDFRYQTAIGATNACAVTPSDNLGIPGAQVIFPGNPDASILYVRMSHRGANQMPPIATNVVDAAGAALLRAWISGMNSSCQ
jgi:uncharacterized repeat protein (TIGR03806 family)